MVGIAATIVVLAAATALLARFCFPNPPMAPVELLAVPLEIEEFSLVGNDGKPFNRAAFQGGWTLVFIGFTSCPDVCPTTLTVLKSVSHRLKGSANPPRVALISVDPQRDRPERLNSYVKFFDPSFVAATGRISELDKLARGLGFTYERVDGDYPGSYTVDHSASLFVIDPHARLVGYFKPPFQAELIANRLRQLLSDKPAG